MTPEQLSEILEKQAIFWDSGSNMHLLAYPVTWEGKRARVPRKKKKALLRRSRELVDLGSSFDDTLRREAQNPDIDFRVLAKLLTRGYGWENPAVHLLLLAHPPPAVLNLLDSYPDEFNEVRGEMELLSGLVRHCRKRHKLDWWNRFHLDPGPATFGLLWPHEELARWLIAEVGLIPR